MTQVNSNRYVTSICNSGYRIGHNLNDQITGFILAEWKKLQYLHSPLPNKNWEDFLGFGDDETAFTDAFQRKISVVSCSPLLGIRNFRLKSPYVIERIGGLETRCRRLQKKIPFTPIQKWRKPYWDGVPFEYIDRVFSDSLDKEEVIYCFQRAVRVMLYQVYQWGKEGKIDQQIYYNAINKLRYKYHRKAHPLKQSYFNPHLINIAIHIRREDATIENQRFLPMNYYVNVIKQLEEILKEYDREFHICSYGSEKDRDEIVDCLTKVTKKIKFHLNEPAMVDFHHMILADILVTSHSSFSDWAGFLSENIKLYHPHFQMLDLDEQEWIVVDDNGKFDRDVVEQKIKMKTATRQLI